MEHEFVYQYSTNCRNPCRIRQTPPVLSYHQPKFKRKRFKWHVLIITVGNSPSHLLFTRSCVSVLLPSLAFSSISFPVLHVPENMPTSTFNAISHEQHPQTANRKPPPLYSIFYTSHIQTRLSTVPPEEKRYTETKRCCLFDRQLFKTCVRMC